VHRDPAISDRPLRARTSLGRWLLLCLGGATAAIALFTVYYGVASYRLYRQLNPITNSTEIEDAEATPQRQLDAIARSIFELDEPNPPPGPNPLQILLGLFDTPASRQRRRLRSLEN